jgi:hypothetical protein
MEGMMGKLLFLLIAAAAVAGCVSAPGPSPVEVNPKETDMDKIEDANGGFIAARLVDASFTPLGFMNESRFLLSVKNLDTGEIFWMRFRNNKKKDLIYYRLAPGRYVVSQVVKEDPIYYDNGSERTKKIRKVPYALPDVLLSEFQVSDAEMIYLGTLTTKDESNKSSIVWDNDYAATKKALTRAAYIMEDITVKPYAEPEGGEGGDSQG